MTAKTFEEALNQLIEKYRENYPHNPKGVFRFHLEKSVKSGLNLIEAFIRLAYENGVKIELVETLREAGLEFSEAIKEASQKLKNWEDKLKSQFIKSPRKPIEELEDEELINYYRQLTKKIIITTTPTIPNYKIVRVLGPVSGLTIRSRGLGGKLAATIESLIGGELKTLTIEFEKAKLEALARMIEKALKLGANAIIGVDFETSDIFAGQAIAFSAYGTAVIIEKEK